MIDLGTRVAVIGAGPAGLAAARYLKAHGFDPVIFEACDGLGGQWRQAGSRSGVWPGLQANASRVVMRFSDLDYPTDVGVFPTREEVLAYLTRYCEEFGLAPHLRLNSRVETLARHPKSGWVVHSVTGEREFRTEIFRRVVVAAGRFTHPERPPVARLESFTGSHGAIHSADYRGPESYRGATVVVAGASISALEIATELALAGVRVISAVRKQRYVIKKLIGGIPADNLAATRFSALANECMPRDAIAHEMKQMIVATSGHPAERGAFPPADDVFEAGITLNDHYLDLVAAGAIIQKPWIAEVDGQTVHFADGTNADVDAIVFGTGFKLDVPFIQGKLREKLGLNAGRLELGDFTFHPGLDGLAFAGLYDVFAPYFPAMELQARWIAYAWAGTVPQPSSEALAASMRQERERQSTGVPLMHELTLRFARNAGVEPRLSDWPDLQRALLFGPLTPISFRLNGPDALPGAAGEVASEAARFGAVTTAFMTADEQEKLAALQAAGAPADVLGAPAAGFDALFKHAA